MSRPQWGSKELEEPPHPHYHSPMRWIALMACASASVSCALAQTSPGGEKPLRIGPVTPFEDRALSESSGVAASRQYEGILWTHNDGGNAAAVYATDTLARRRGTFLLVGLENRDWEDIALGPCPGRPTCLYIGDVGDNLRRYQTATLYRFAEPDPGAQPPDSTGRIVTIDSLVFRYPNGPEDVESMYVDPAGTVFLISKNGSDGVQRYRIAADQWGSRGVVTAEWLGPFPIEPGATRLAGVTGADLSADGHRLVVRTYRELFFYLVDDQGDVGRGPIATCPVLGLESQGEGVAWLDQDRVALTSERGVFGRGTVAVVQCRIPAPSK